MSDDVTLTPSQVAYANSFDGIHAVTIAAGWTPEVVPSEHLFEFYQMSMTSFMEAHEGYRLAEILSECFDGVEAEFFLNSGAWEVRKDFRGSAPTHDAVPTPIVVGLNRAEARKVERSATVTATLFLWRQVRYCFSQDQQHFLQLAMDYLTDKELARALSITETAVGRRWTRIFKRVEALQPNHSQVFPPGSDRAGKRTRLTVHLASGLHELRPHVFRPHVFRPNLARQAVGKSEAFRANCP